jgi:alkylated DNA nucleotide flippase Atl1
MAMAQNVPMARKSKNERVLAAIAAIPEGRATTYGGLGKKLRLTARQVASVLSHLTREDADSVPWHRVVGSGGVISTLKLGEVGRRQIERLEAEGVVVSARGKIADFAEVCL